MLKTYASVLVVYLPSAQQFKNSFKILYRDALALASGISHYKPNFASGRVLLYQKQFKPDALGTKILRVPTTLALIALFLFIGPHTSVLANWEEKVVPDNCQLINKPITDSVKAVAIPKFTMPLTNTYISTYFSRWHQGIDLPNPYGSGVHPVASGKVVFAGWSPLGYGNMVIVRHKLGYESLYAHLAQISVKEGDSVTSDSILGGVGATGIASGNHLHLEIHLQGGAVNPLGLIK